MKCASMTVIFRDKHLDLDQCPSCGEPRRLNGCVRKSFTYMPIGPRLARWFGTSNLCQLLYADKISINGTLTLPMVIFTNLGFEKEVCLKI